MRTIVAEQFEGLDWNAIRKRLALTDGESMRFEDCIFSEVDFSDSELSGFAFVGGRMTECNFNRAILDDSQWERIHAPGSLFQNASCESAVFIGSNFSNSEWSGSKLTGARFKGCKMTGGCFDRTRALDASFESSLLDLCILKGFSFRSRDLNEVDFTESDLAGADFRECTFDRCSLRGANLKGAHFKDADLRGADLGELRLVDLEPIRGAVISASQADVVLRSFGIRVL